jgi:uncharacterized protein
MSSTLPGRAITANIETQAFWDATAQGQLLLPHCNSCQTVIWYPRGHCPVCMSTDLSWIPSSGKGVVYSFSITRSGGGAWKPASPYVLAYVELAEGPRVLTNIVNCDVDDVRIGMAVHVEFDDVIEGTAIYRFAPD